MSTERGIVLLNHPLVLFPFLQDTSDLSNGLKAGKRQIKVSINVNKLQCSFTKSVSFFFLQVWYSNVPHTKLVQIKGHQNWVKVSGEYLTFPGGGTQFKKGARHYIEFIEQVSSHISLPTLLCIANLYAVIHYDNARNACFSFVCLTV